MEKDKTWSPIKVGLIAGILFAILWGGVLWFFGWQSDVGAFGAIIGPIIAGFFFGALMGLVAYAGKKK